MVLSKEPNDLMSELVGSAFGCFSCSSLRTLLVLRLEGGRAGCSAGTLGLAGALCLGATLGGGFSVSPSAARTGLPLALSLDPLPAFLTGRSEELLKP